MANQQNENIELYKTYVDMADRFSARRVQIPITYFSFLTAIVVAMSFIIDKEKSFESKIEIKCLLFTLTLMGIALCFFWWQSIKRYKHLGEIKYEVIREMELRMFRNPFRPYANEIVKEKEADVTKNQKHLQHFVTYEAVLPMIAVIPFLVATFYLIIQQLT